MYNFPHDMEYKLSGMVNMNTNSRALVQAELELIGLKYGFKLEVTKDEVHDPNGFFKVPKEDTHDKHQDA